MLIKEGDVTSQTWTVGVAKGESEFTEPDIFFICSSNFNCQVLVVDYWSILFLSPRD